jgi:CubicO group peptidase (beta-lactamase class C family)
MKKLLPTTCLFVVTIIAIVSFSASTVFGQEKKTADVNSSSLDSLTARIDKLFEKWNKPDLPGCALGVIRDGKLIYKRGYGMANIKDKIPMTSKSLIEIGSMDKQFTATSILLLAQRGKLSLDDDIRKYVPEMPVYTRIITIRQLLHHMSGIRDIWNLVYLSGIDIDQTGGDKAKLSNEQQGLALIARQKATNFLPGDEFQYSNSGYFLLRLIVERVSGKTLHEFQEANIGAPLGMKHTHFHDNLPKIDPLLATGYMTTGTSEPCCKGGLWSNVEDLLLWDQNFYHKKVGGQALQDELHRVGMLTNGEKLTYASGLRVSEYRGLPTVAHGGESTIYLSMMVRFPQQNFSVVCLCNFESANPSDLAYRVADIFLADQFKKETVDVNKTTTAAPDIISIPEKELASLAGLYFDPVKEDIIRFYMKDAKLMVAKGPGFVLSPLSQNHFTVVGAPHEIVFILPTAGGRMQVKDKDISSGKTVTYDAVHSLTLTPAQLADFTGKYVSEELEGATYTLSVKDGKLNLQVRNQKDVLLTPVFADAFFGRGIIRFTRNQQNAVSGFTVTIGSVRRLHFEKL